MNEVIEITIFTAKFIEFKEDDSEKYWPPSSDKIKAILDVRLDNGVVQRRSFNRHLVEGIKNPRRILIGISIKPGQETTTFIDGNRYWKLFEKCGWVEKSFEEKVNSKRKRNIKKILK